MPGISAICIAPMVEQRLNQFYDLKDMSDRVTNSLGNYTGERLKEISKDNNKLISSTKTNKRFKQKN